MLISRLESLVIVATKVFYSVKRAVCNVLPQFIKIIKLCIKSLSLVFSDAFIVSPFFSQIN